jgi:purine-nucleoside phosphorylase
MIQIVRDTVDFLKARGIEAPEIAVIIGTGLGSQFVKRIQPQQVIPYSEIPDFPTSTVESHQGKFVYGDLHGKKVLAMQGRFHYYEGYDMQQITLPVRVMKLLGCRYLLISNAAGNLNLERKKGSLMLIDDHINLQSENPLRGKNIDAFGPRFPDMSRPYSKTLNEKLIAIAEAKGITLHEGVYAAVSGPNLETRAEYRFLKMIGADAVGMSTVPEVIVANQMSFPCCAVSVLTDDCDPDNLKPVSLAEIIAVAASAEISLTTLYCELIAQL